jgi:valyl-tRNA synthetase
MKDQELPKYFEPAVIEPQAYAVWEAAGLFHEEPDPARPPFIIAMPPPNITGRAHLGHGSTYTAMDVLTRYHRMKGENADWIPGQDHAAIATEAVLVRDLAAKGESRESLGRERFLEHAWAWREKYGSIIEEQFRTLGFGADWRRKRFTMDPGLSAAVNRAFVRLYDEGLIYRGRRLVNWDPKAHSTLSDAEVEHEERPGELWHIRYRAEDGGEGVVVATTRPETILGDTAVAVHPEDERYAHLLGKRVLLPLFGRSIPVVADASVDPRFGTGAVKVTPAHDATDYEIGLRHGLPMPSILDEDANICASEPELTGSLEPYAGMNRFAARKAILASLESTGALVSVEAYRLNVALSSRSHEIIEPMLSLQWFLRMESLAEPALAAYRDGRIRFIPERHGRTYEQWLSNIRDWNISRQIWWGHRLPVWYTPDGDVVVAETEEAALASARERFGEVALERDQDTLDTWFSSGLWPFSILGWPSPTPEFAHWYPTQALVTAREIIFLWVARMVMLGMKLAGGIPFRDVVITPLVFDDQGRKMSKSLGNAIDPLRLVADYGADATRFGILRQMHLEAQELRFSEGRCAEAAKFNNKIWNALAYALSLPEGLPAPGVLPREPSTADRWILTELYDFLALANGALDRYDFGAYAEAILHFMWYRLCDWYIEASKVATPSRAGVLSYVLNAAMRVMHPLMPFITDEVWKRLPHDGASIVTASWPDLAEIPVDRDAHARFEGIIEAVGSARAFRASANLKPNERLEVVVPARIDDEAKRLISALAVADVHDGELESVMVRARPEMMRARLERERKRHETDLERSRARLANEAFLANAPAETVKKERERLAQSEEALRRIDKEVHTM